MEFYAPWCGHCKNLQPAYEKAAKSLAGLAKVAAIDCDEESNKSFCGSMGVQGFPTLKIVRPGKKRGKPTVEDYQGPRTAKGIVEYVTDKIPNLVKKVEDKSLESWLAAANGTAKAILFTDKGKTSSLLKAIAIDFKGGIQVAQIRDKEKASMELFGITKVPTLILLPGGKEAEGMVYDGQLKKEAIVKFLSQVNPPNPDPPAAKAKPAKSAKKEAKTALKDRENFEKSSASHKSEEASSEAASATEEVVEEATDSPSPEIQKEKPVILPAPPISLLDSETMLVKECLGPRTGTCILAVLPDKPGEITLKTIQVLSEIADKHWKAGRKTFPFYAVPPTNPRLKQIREALGLNEQLDVIAVNGRRGWWRQLKKLGDEIEEGDIAEDVIENWVENIKLGEGAKNKIPEGLIPEESAAEPVGEAEEPVKVEAETVKAEEPFAEEKTDAEAHDEL